MQLLNSNIPQSTQNTKYSDKKTQDLLNLVLFIFCSFFVLQRWRKRGDSNPWAREDYTISNRARYDHFDTLPYYVFILKLCRDFYRQLFYFICFLFKCQLFFKRFIKLFKVFWFYSLARRFSYSLCSVNFDINHLLNKFWYDTIP